MTGTFYSVTIVGTRRRLDLSLPADVPVGELTGELAALLDEPAGGPPPRWGLVRLGGDVVEAELGLAEQRVAPGSMLFLRDLDVAVPPPAVDDYATAVAAAVEASPWRWTPDRLQAFFVAAAVAWVLATGALAGVWLAAGGVASAPGFLAVAAVVAAGAVTLGRMGGQPASGIALALSALPLWAAAGLGLLAGAALPRTDVVAGGLVAVAVGGLAAGGAAADAAALGAGVAAATLPWAVTLALLVGLGGGPAAGAATLVPVAVTALRLLPWVVVRLARLDGAPPVAAIPARAAAARRLLGALTAGIAATLAGACVVLAMDPTWWGRGLAIAAALSALLHARRRRFVAEVAPLLLVALATLATFELLLVGGAAGGLADWERLALPPATAAVLAGLGLLGRAVRLPVGVRRQLEWGEALAATSTAVLALGLLGLYDAAARVAGRFA